MEIDVLPDQPRQDLVETVNGVVDIQRTQFDLLLAAEGQEAAGQVHRPLAGGEDALDVFFERIISFQLHLQQRSVADDGRQDIVEIMGHASGQDADGFHFLRLAQLFFQFLALGNVAHHGQQKDRPATRLIRVRLTSASKAGAVDAAMPPFEKLGVAVHRRP